MTKHFYFIQILNKILNKIFLTYKLTLNLFKILKALFTKSNIITKVRIAVLLGIYTLLSIHTFSCMSKL